MRLPIARAAVIFAALALAASALDAQIATIPFGGPKKVRPSAAANLRGSPSGIAAAVAMKGRPFAMTKLDESRRPVEVLEFLGLPLGARVLDVLAGSGYYSEIIGNAVGANGKVTALILPEAMKDPTERATISGVVGRVPSVSILAESPAAVQFAPNRYDFVLMHLVYHDLYWEDAASGYVRTDPAVFLKKVFDALRPGGVVGVVDHAATPGGDTRDVVAKLHRIDPATVKADFIRAGFVLDGESTLLRKADDDHSLPAFDPAISGKTDRFVFRFHKPE